MIDLLFAGIGWTDLAMTDGAASGSLDNRQIESLAKSRLRRTCSRLMATD
jgi:hypothetical protein